VSEGAGTSVAIEGSCFSPTILRTDVGAMVTFQNRDPTTHNVLGAHGTWGSWDALKRGHELSFRFGGGGRPGHDGHRPRRGPPPSTRIAVVRPGGRAYPVGAVVR
jgi:hypothetical protein